MTACGLEHGAIETFATSAKRRVNHSVTRNRLHRNALHRRVADLHLPPAVAKLECTGKVNARRAVEGLTTGLQALVVHLVATLPLKKEADLAASRKLKTRMPTDTTPHTAILIGTGERRAYKQG
jgi:hypothetical protein